MYYVPDKLEQLWKKKELVHWLNIYIFFFFFVVKIKKKEVCTDSIDQKTLWSSKEPAGVNNLKLCGLKSCDRGMALSGSLWIWYQIYWQFRPLLRQGCSSRKICSGKSCCACITSWFCKHSPFTIKIFISQNQPETGPVHARGAELGMSHANK